MGSVGVGVGSVWCSSRPGRKLMIVDAGEILGKVCRQTLLTSERVFEEAVDPDGPSPQST